MKRNKMGLWRIFGLSTLGAGALTACGTEGARLSVSIPNLASLFPIAVIVAFGMIAAFWMPDDPR